MPTPNDTITLTIGGNTHADWKNYRIESDLMLPADAWSVSLGGMSALTLPSGKRIQFPPALTAALPGAKVDVRLGDDLVMRGVVDSLDEDISKTAHSVDLAGRDLAGQLLDCSAPIFTAELISLPALVKKIVSPFGITQVRIDASAPLTRTKVNVEPGDTAWSALQRVAEANGLYPWFEPSGVLVIGRPDYTTTPVGTLIMRMIKPEQNNILSAHRSRCLHDVYSEVAVLGQTPGTAKSGGHRGILAKAISSQVGLYRPHFVTDHECDTAKVAKNRAAKLLSDGLLEADNLVIKVRGHRTDSGTPWTPGQRVKVIIDPYNIDGEIWFVMGRTFVGGRDGGQTTELKLKRDGLWQLDAHPHKNTHRRGKNAAPVQTTFAN